MHKLALSLLAVIVFSILGLGWGIDNIFNRYSGDSNTDRLALFEEIGSSLSFTLDSSVDAENIIEQLNNKSDVSLSLTPVQEFSLPPELNNRFLNGRPLSLESDQGVVVNFYLPKTRKVLGIRPSKYWIEQSQSKLSLILTVLFYLGIILLVFLWLQPLINQLTKLKKTTKAFGEGNLEQRIPSGSVTYISDIESTFNQMAQRIETLIADNKLLTKAVSHDLRTPLARLRFGVDALAEANDLSIKKKYQKRISQDLEEMEALVETLLSYARLNQTIINVKKKRLNFKQVVLNCVDNLESGIKTVRVVVEKRNIYIHGNEQYLSMLVNNLCRNAVQYAHNQIQISISIKNKNILLSVEDNGDGIPENEREQVIKPFVRGRNTELAKGYGMGLAIVETIVKWHEAELVVEHSEVLGGAKLLVIFKNSGLQFSLGGTI